MRTSSSASKKKHLQNLRFAADSASSSSAGPKSRSPKKNECQDFCVLEEHGYRNFRKVGSGAYGVVCSAEDGPDRRVAIKRVHPWADDEWDARHTLRELRLMRLLSGHPNIISLLDCVLCPDDSKDLFIVMELMESDLHRIIASKQALTPAHVSCLTAQLLLGIQAMHSVGVLHRDLKPGNLLVSRGCQLRITDFGLSRYVGRDKIGSRRIRSSVESESKSDDSESEDDDDKKVRTLKHPLTEYVVTRWYRCPEVLLAPHLPYTSAVDCWSAGCIFAELIRRKPVFQGKNFVHQVQVILERLGTPNDYIGFEPREDAARFLAKQPRHKAPGFKSLLPSANTAQLKFAESLLQFDPTKRATVDDALADSYFDDAPELPGRSKLFFTPGSNRVSRAFRDSVQGDDGFEFGFENPSTPIDDLRAAVEADVALVRAAKNRRLTLDNANVSPGDKSEASSCSVPGPMHDDRFPGRRHSADDVMESRSDDMQRTLAKQNSSGALDVSAKARPSRSRLFGIPLLRSSKKKATRIRPSPSPLTPEISDDHQGPVTRRHFAQQQDLQQSEKTTSMLSRFRSKSNR